MKKRSIILVVLVIVILVAIPIYIFLSTPKIQPGNEEFLMLYEDVVRLVMNEKENLNDDASYIAISVDSFNIIDASYAQGIISYLTSYNDKVINISYLELKNGNYFDENGSLEGIYINTEIIKTNKTKDKIELVVSKTKSSLAKVSIKCRATFKNGSWVIKEI